MKFLIFVFVSIFILPHVAFAEHEADHRYFVSGFVRDEAGNPKKDVVVSIEHRGGQKKTATTNRRGYYEVMFHLHDDNIGDEIVVTAGNEVKRHTMAFDRSDHVSERRGEVNFGAPGKDSPYEWIYWTGGLVLVAGVAVGLRSFRKKKKVKKAPARKKRK